MSSFLNIVFDLYIPAKNEQSPCKQDTFQFLNHTDVAVLLYFPSIFQLSTKHNAPFYPVPMNYLEKYFNYLLLLF